MILLIRLILRAVIVPWHQHATVDNKAGSYFDKEGGVNDANRLGRCLSTIYVCVCAIWLTRSVAITNTQ